MYKKSSILLLKNVVVCLFFFQAATGFCSSFKNYFLELAEGNPLYSLRYSQHKRALFLTFKVWGTPPFFFCFILALLRRRTLSSKVSFLTPTLWRNFLDSHFLTRYHWLITPPTHRTIRGFNYIAIPFPSLCYEKSLILKWLSSKDTSINFSGLIGGPYVLLREKIRNYKNVNSEESAALFEKIIQICLHCKNYELVGEVLSILPDVIKNEKIELLEKSKQDFFEILKNKMYPNIKSKEVLEKLLYKLDFFKNEANQYEYNKSLF